MQMDAIRTPHIETIKVNGSASNHNCALRTLRRIFHIAVDLDIVPKIPKFSLLEENKRTQLITPEIEDKIAAELSTRTRKGSLNAALYLILDCGLRPIEIVNLKIEDVNMAQGSIRVTKSKTEAGKRLVVMTNRVKGVLFAHIGKRTEAWLSSLPLVIVASRLNVMHSQPHGAGWLMMQASRQTLICTAPDIPTGLM
jgi:integrase